MRDLFSTGNEKGQSVVFAVLIISLIFLFGCAALSISATVRKTAAFECNQVKAYYIAEAGVEKALAESRQGSAWLKNLSKGSDRDFLADNLSGKRGYAGGVFEKVNLKKLSESPGGTELEIKSWGKCLGSTKKVKVNVNLDNVYAENYFRGLWLKNSNAPGVQKIDLYADCCFSDGDAVFNKGSTVTGNVYCRGKVILESDEENGTYIDGDIYSLGGVVFTGSFPSVITGLIYVDDLNKVPAGVRDIARVMSVADLLDKIPGPGDFPELLDEHKISWYRNNADYVNLPPEYEAKIDFENGIYYLSGDQYLSGVYSGNAVLIIDGNVTLGNLRKDDELNDSVTIFATGSVSTDSINQQVQALVYSKTEVSLKNGSVLKGCVLCPVLSGQGSQIRIIYDRNAFDRYKELLNWSACFLTITRWSEEDGLI
jgi:hypothetical protein